ncbi:putative glycosyltransferase EpsJ [Lactobacillus helveticus]|nr:putative glycosyltransferase EpsJ [Lactobacillus helveticus]
MKKLPIISIIVPVFNVEKLLSRCIESIQNQTFKNFELILVNDGSTDNSKYICESYCKNDLRIKLINKANGGRGDARNLG